MLTFFYKIKHGRATPVYCDGGVFTPVEIRLWRDGQSLYAADLEQDAEPAEADENGAKQKAPVRSRLQGEDPVGQLQRPSQDQR